MDAEEEADSCQTAVLDRLFNAPSEGASFSGSELVHLRSAIVNVLQDSEVDVLLKAISELADTVMNHGRLLLQYKDKYRHLTSDPSD